MKNFIPKAHGRYWMACLIAVTGGSFLFNPAICQPRTPYPPEGKMVDGGGHLIHIHVMGKGGPAVIMENGSGDFSFVWSLVQPEVSKFTTAVTYDRAGFAWSEPGPYPRSARQINFELHTALKKAGIKGPFILVGQSFGGFLVRDYAHDYPNEVIGMVLVDALNEDSKIIINNQPMRIRDWATGRPYPEPRVIHNEMADKSQAENSETITYDSTLEPPLDRLPEHIRNLQIWAQNQPQFRVAVDSEMTWSPEDVALLYSNKGKPGFMLGDMPLIVMTRGDGGYEGRPDSAALESERMKQQDELAHLSTNGKLIIDRNSGHNIHLEDPQAVIEAIHEVTEAIRNHSRVR